MRVKNSYVFSLCPLLLLAMTCMMAISSRPIRAEDTVHVQIDSVEGYYIIETKHRLFPNFQQVDSIEPGGRFLLGEEDYVVEVDGFNPHLGITTEGDYLQMSDTLYNPAIRLRVLLGDSLVQESWGFHFVDAPHYYREELFGFRLIDFALGDAYIQVPEKKSDSASRK